MRLLLLLSVCAAGLLVRADAPSWELDFTRGMPPKMGWWSANKKADQCRVETVSKALEVTWDGVGDWMHVYQSPVPEPFPQAARVLVTARVIVPEESVGRVRQCRLRIQDRNQETFYLTKNVIWSHAGAYDLSWIVTEPELVREAVAHGRDQNKKLDHPVTSLGLSFVFARDSGACRMQVARLAAQALEPVDPAAYRAQRLAGSFLAAAHREMLYGNACTATRETDKATGKTVIRCAKTTSARVFGVSFTRFGSPMGVLAPKFPRYEEATLTLDVVTDGAAPIDGVRLRLVDAGSGVQTLDVKDPSLAQAGRHAVTVKLPVRMAGTSLWGKDKMQRLFALGGVLFTSSKPGAPTTVILEDITLAWKALPAETFALDLETGDEVHFIGRDVTAVAAKFANVSDCVTDYAVALALEDVRGVNAGLSTNLQLRLAGGAVQTFSVPVPARDGVYYVKATVTAAGSEPWEPVLRERSFLRAMEAGASPRLANPDDFCFGSVAHLNPYFGCEAEMRRVARTMSRAGLKVLRTDFRVGSDFDWMWYDRVVEIFTGVGMDIDFILGNQTDPDGTPRWDDLRARYRKAFARYRGRVRFWEMLNEPDTDWGCKHPTTAADYARLSLRTAADLRECDPGATFMSAGFCCFDHKIMGTFQKDALAAAWKCFDLHCFHGHGPYGHYRKTIDNKLLGLRRELGITIPWYANETAISCARGTGEYEQAKTLYKKLLFSWSRGARGLTWYNLRGKGENELEGEHGYGMMTFDLYPRAVYGAWNALTAFYAHQRYLGEREAGKDVTAFAFGRGTTRTVCLWHEKPGTRSCTFRTAATQVARVDMFGNRHPLAVQDGKFTVTTSPEPVSLILQEGDLVLVP